MAIADMAASQSLGQQAGGHFIAAVMLDALEGEQCF